MGNTEWFNSRMRDELLDGELFLHIDETKYVVGRWMMDYNHYRPHKGLGYITPAGFAELCRQAADAGARWSAGMWSFLIDAGPKKHIPAHRVSTLFRQGELQKVPLCSSV